MFNLQHKFRTSYINHPSFKGISPMTLGDDSLLKEFGEAYRKLNPGTLKNNPEDYQVNKKICLYSISKIFKNLKNQTDDNCENLFLTELESEVNRLFLDEVDNISCPKLFSKSFQGISKSNLISLSKFYDDKFIFGEISKISLDKINAIGAPFLSIFRSRVKEGKLTRHDLSFGACLEANKISKILDEEFERLGVNAIISSYSGKSMHVGGVGYELSVPQANWWKNQISEIDAIPKTLYAHLDESIRFPKAIVYLSDVLECNGPTGCYPKVYEDLGLNPLMEIIGRVIGNVGNNIKSPLYSKYQKTYHQSSSSLLFRKHFMRLPEELRFNSHFGWDVLPGSEFEENLANREKRLIGPAGSFVAFDGSKLLHRGGLIERGERVVLQVIFVEKPSFIKRVANKFKRIFSVNL